MERHPGVTPPQIAAMTPPQQLLMLKVKKSEQPIDPRDDPGGYLEEMMKRNG